MHYRTLGQTGLKISRLGLGGIPLQRSSRAEAAEILAVALAAGINFIDTARGYSISEELIGQGLGSSRSHWILASKSMQRTKEGILNDIRISLKNMATDYLDLYQLHNIRTPEQWQQATGPDGALEGLQEACKEGLIRSYGITSHSEEIMSTALESKIFATMMFPYNAVENANKRLFSEAKEKAVGTMAMKPLAGGFIRDTGKAIRYLAADSNVDCILVGMDNPSQIKANISALEQGPLSAGEAAELGQWAADAGLDFCRRCGYCLPCPQGIDIPSVFLLEGYYDRYELQGWSQERYQAMEVSAEACQNCGRCKERCPYNLSIPEKLAKAAAKLATR